MSSPGVHGDEQLLRPTMVPSWDTKQSRARPDELAGGRDIPFTSAVSAWIVVSVGSWMNARSFRDPSPFTSPLTVGVYACPALMRAMAVRSNQARTGYVIVASIECRRSRSDVPHSTTFGLPAVV